MPAIYRPTDRRALCSTDYHCRWYRTTTQTDNCCSYLQLNQHLTTLPAVLQPTTAAPPAVPLLTPAAPPAAVTVYKMDRYWRTTPEGRLFRKGGWCDGAGARHLVRGSLRACCVFRRGLTTSLAPHLDIFVIQHSFASSWKHLFKSSLRHLFNSSSRHIYFITTKQLSYY